MEVAPRDWEWERERERERDWDLDWDRVVGPPPPPLPLLPSVELMESEEKDRPLRRRPPLLVCVRPREVDLDLLVEAFSLSLSLCLFFLVEVGLEAFLVYRLGAVVSGRWSEGKGEVGRVRVGDRDPDTVLMEASPPSPEGGEELCHHPCRSFSRHSGHTS